MLGLDLDPDLGRLGVDHPVIAVVIVCECRCGNEVTDEHDRSYHNLRPARISESEV